MELKRNLPQANHGHSESELVQEVQEPSQDLAHEEQKGPQLRVNSEAWPNDNFVQSIRNERAHEALLDIICNN